MSNNLTQIVWAEPFMQACEGRVDARVRPDEIPAALDFFREHLKHEPTVLYLNSDMIKRLGKVIPEGIEIIEHNGVLSWEIRAADGDKVFLPTKLSPNTPGDLPSKKEVMETPCNMPDNPQDAKISAVTPLSGKPSLPLSVLSRQKSQRVKKEVLTHHSPNPVKTVTQKPLSKLLRGKKIPPATDKTTRRALRHGGGRPRKQKGYSERTFYRRKKENREKVG